MSEKPLSKRQHDILQFTRGYMEENGRPPTIREIGKAVRINSTSVVNYNLSKLEERGFLSRDHDVSRGLRLTEKANEITDGISQAVGRLLRIPIWGNIGASASPLPTFDDFELLARDDEENGVVVPQDMIKVKPDRLYALKVNGDSMIDAMVNDGDTVIVQPQYEARNGEMVAVYLKDDTSATLKRFYAEDGRVRLQPANPTLDPIYVNPEEVRIQGKVVLVIREPN